jgi:hypothetical protein
MNRAHLSALETRIKRMHWVALRRKLQPFQR